MIQEKKGVPSDELKLKFVDLLLEDDHCTLSDHNILDGSTLIYNCRTGKLPWLFRYYYPPNSYHTGESALKIGLVIGKDPHRCFMCICMYACVYEVCIWRWHYVLPLVHDCLTDQ